MIPEELRNLRQWVVWRSEERSGKKTKVPFAVDGRHAKSTDPSTWSSFADVHKVHTRFDGLGFVVDANDPFTGLDLDECIRGGEPDPDARALVRNLDSYTELSPSGTGLRIFVEAKLKEGSRNRTPETPWKGNLEVYNERRFFTVTGNKLDGAPDTIEERQEELADIVGVLLPPKPEPVGKPMGAQVPLDLDQETLLNIARHARNGDEFAALYDRGEWEGPYKSQSEADLTLCSHLLFYAQGDTDRTDRLFRGSALMRDKWNKSNYGQRTITKALSGLSNIYTPPKQSGNQSNGAQKLNSPSASPPTEAAEIVEEAIPYEPDMDDFLAGDDEDYDWLIPGVMERSDRLLLIGREGVGKSMLLHQVATQVASGIHPFGDEPFAGLRVLLVDLENPKKELQRRLRSFRLKAKSQLERQMVFVRSRPEGLELSEEGEDREWLWERVRNTRAELLVIGPLYKMILGGDPDKEVFAKPTALFLDRLRVEFGVAVVLEHYMPHDSNRPFGWSGWRRWPEIGLELTKTGALVHWRPPRHDTPSVPPALKRGGEWPFTMTSKPIEELWSKIATHCRSYAIKRPTVRELATLLDSNKTQVGRAISAHKDEWDELFED